MVKKKKKKIVDVFDFDLNKIWLLFLPFAYMFHPKWVAAEILIDFHCLVIQLIIVELEGQKLKPSCVSMGQSHLPFSQEVTILYRSTEGKE